MDRVRLMAADDNRSLVTSIANYFSEKQDVEWLGGAADGAEALEMIDRLRPDLLILDVVMPKLDGFDVLEALAPRSDAPKIIMLTSLRTDDAIDHAISLGASYYMLKPASLDALYARVMMVMGQREQRPRPAYAEPEPVPAPQSAEERVANLFLMLGMPAHIKGYQYLRYAVNMVTEEHDVINRITKELYPGVARRFETTASKVERAMRHAIEVAWNRGRIDSINKQLGFPLFFERDKPTNGEFIALVADKVANAPYKEPPVLQSAVSV